ncbi:MAG TPA: XRE family transcriptional regulator [Daejeonella sp.]|uniref:helix-turn-helix domain-containing protein n=1 Tax=Daejeonella sp. TaxID=2805397 RepID=UPI002EDAF677
METINPKMLILGREARGLTQAELANQLDRISQANYSRMEKGIINVNEEQISEIANTLNFPLDFFKRPEPKGTQVEYFYRKKATLPKKKQYELEANFNLLRLWLNDMLAEIDIPDFVIPEIEIEHTNTPETIAKRIRIFFGISKGPIDALINVLEKRGIIVYFLSECPDKFDGTTIITAAGTRVIVVNGKMPNYRKRFTIAHELCHIICHIPFSDTDPYRNVENEANRFASEFLMPADECISDLYRLTYSKLTDLKNYWNVSKSAIIRRASDLGCITKDKYTHLMIELSRYNERKSEKTDVPLDEPKILKKMVDSYLNDMGYTKDELMKSLTINEEDFSRFLVRDNVRRLQIAI